MATNTPNFNLIKPAVNDPVDQDLWGGYLNENFDTIDTVMKANEDAVSPVTNPQSSDYTIQASDKNKMILIDTSGGNVTLTLLAAATAGDGFKVSFKKISAANTLNISGSIDGASGISVTDNNDAFTIISDGTSWYYESEYSPGSDSAEIVVQRKVIQDATTFTFTAATYTASGIQFSLDNDLQDVSNKVRIRLESFAGVGPNQGNALYFTIQTGGTDLAGSFSALAGVTFDTPNGPTESAGVVPFSILVERTPGSVTPETYELFARTAFTATSSYIGQSSDGSENLPTTIIIEEIQTS